MRLANKTKTGLEKTYHINVDSPEVETNREEQYSDPRIGKTIEEAFFFEIFLKARE